MQVTILHADDVHGLSKSLQNMKESVLPERVQYITIRNIENSTTEELLEYANRPEYMKYVSSMFASTTISHLEKNINGLNTQIQELESKKQRHDKTMEKISPGSNIISSLKPMAYHKHIEMPSIMSIEDSIRKISRAYNELDKVSVSRGSLIMQLKKVNTQLENLMKEFNATTKDMEVVVRKYNLRKYLSSLIDTIQSPDTDINDIEKAQTELDRLMKQFKLSSPDEATDVVSNYVSPSSTTIIPMKGDSDYRKHKPYTYLAKPGKKYYTIDIIKINKMVPRILSANDAIERILDQSNELLEKTSQLNKDIDSNEDTMKELVRGTPLERANIDRSTTLNTFKQYRKKYIHVEDAIDTYDLNVKQQTSLKRARRLRDNKLDQIEELQHQIKKIQYKVNEHNESIDFTFVEDAASFARKMYFDIFQQTRVGIEDPVSKSMFFLKCSSSKNIIIDSLLQPIYSLRDQSVMNMINALSKYPMDKAIYLTSSTKYTEQLIKHVDADTFKFDEHTTIQSFISSITR
jgi:uncharacterized protein YoxC